MGLSGLITGTPTAAGTFSTTVTARNGNGSDSASFTWTVAPVNLALNRPALASSVEVSGFSADLAVDGRGETRWSSAPTDAQWLQVDLGASYSINSVNLVWEYAYGSSYQIQVSPNGSTWSTIYTKTAGTGGTEKLTNLHGIGRYVRMLGVKRGTQYGYSLCEMEVYGGLSMGVWVTNPGSQNTMVGNPVSLQIAASDSNGAPLPLTYGATGLPAGLSINAATGLISGTPTAAGTFSTMVTASNGNGSDSASFTWTVAPVASVNLALNRPALASSVEASGFSADLAVDGRGETRWSSAHTDAQWLQVDLGASYSITSVNLVWEYAYGSSYQIQVSPNGSTWSTIYTKTTGTGGTEKLTNLHGIGRYVRVLGVQRGTQYGYSLYEMEVYGGLPMGVWVTNPGSQNTMVGNPVSLQIAASDSNGAPLPLIYGATGLPVGLNINAATGLISGTPTSAGTFSTTVTASNGNGSDSASFTWTVAPVASVNLALNRPALASSVEASGFSADLAVDGRGETRWSSAHTDAQWLQVDLGASYSITSVNLVWEYAYGSSYQIQVSPNGSTWSTIYTKTTGTGGTEKLTNLHGIGRYVRILGVQRGTQYGYSLYEMEVYGGLPMGVWVTNPGSQNTMVGNPVSLQIAASDSNGAPLSLIYGATGLPVGLSINTTTGLISGTPTAAGTFSTTVTASNGNGSDSASFTWTVAPVASVNLALNRPALASSVEVSAFSADLAVDGRGETRWSSAHTDAQWLQVDLGASYSINRVNLVWESAYGSSYQIQVSPNGSTWSTIYTMTAGTGGGDELTNLHGIGRYVRMLGVRRGTQYGYSLYEMEVYGN